MSVLFDEGGNRLQFHCPGCGEDHTVSVTPGIGWGWNKSMDKPTFTPSVKAWRLGCKKGPNVEVEIPPYVCHSFVEDGRIRFLDDCTHAAKNTTLDLLPW